MQEKLLAIVGPTASGKSELAIALAKKFNGEIISADSRQIYKGMDIGTGKVAGKWLRLPFARHPERSEGSHLGPAFIYKGIAHHCIDFVQPKSQYSVAKFKKQADKAIAGILKRGHLPILCGGTGHWIDAVVYNQTLPNVKPNFKLRWRLEKKSANYLYAQLKKLDAARAKTIDRFNKRRLIRALEIITATGKPVPKLKIKDKGLTLNTFWIGIKTNQSNLYKKIDARLQQRIKQGMVKEVARLHRQGLSWKKLVDFGLEYKYVSLYLQKKLAHDDMQTQLSYAIKHYAKRQMTWFKKNKAIWWVVNFKQAEKLITKEFKPQN